MSVRLLVVATVLGLATSVALHALQALVSADGVVRAASVAIGAASLVSLYVVLSLMGVFVPKQSPEALAAALAPHLEVVKPPGEGPFPVVLQFHGCGGQIGPDGDRNPIMRDYAERAAAAGVAAVIVDSLEPRGISRAEALARVCKGYRLRGGERAGDVLVALDLVRGFAWADCDRLAVAGWSHGAWAIMDLLSMDLNRVRPHNLSRLPEARLSGLKAAHLTYPFCGFPARTRDVGWAWRPRARVVLAGEDELALERDVRAALARMEASGVAVEAVVTPHVTHGFDEPRHEPGATMRPDPDAAAAARAAYGAWLARVLAA